MAKNLEITHPQQLNLFKLIGEEKADYSQTIELYEVLPKYYYGNVNRINEKFLDEIQREFVFRGKKYFLKLVPALIENSKGEEKAYYPSQREEIVEDALRKVAIEKSGVYIDGGAGVQFTLYEIEKELKKRGHGYSKSQIKEAIRICHNTSIEIKSEDGKDELSFHVFEAIGFSSRNLKDKENRKAFVKFNSLVTKSINEGTFRLFNYKKCMSLKNMLSRWMFKRISHHFLQASSSNPYEIKLTTIIRDSGMAKYARITDNKKQIKKSLDEMYELNILTEYKESVVYDTRRKNKIEDIIFSLWLSEDFCKDVRKANYFQQKQQGEPRLVQDDIMNKKEELEKKIQDRIYDLPKEYIKQYIKNIDEEEDIYKSLQALEAAKQVIELNKQNNNKIPPARTTKAALKERWTFQNANNEEEIVDEEEEKGVWNISKNELHQERFDQFLDIIKKEIGQGSYDSWFKRVNLLEIHPKIKLEAKSRFIKEWILTNYEDVIMEAGKGVFNVSEIEILVNKNNTTIQEKVA